CWLEGHEVHEGSVSSLRLDPCVKCTCSKGFLICEKKSCPVLSCPPSKAIISSDGCCPVCNGSREIYVPPEGRCFLGKFLYKSGDNRSFDDCTTCTCQLGFLTCERKTCPPLKCPEQYRKTAKGECCPSCVYPSRSMVCFMDGILREHGDQWRLDKCSTCNCTEGRVTCQADSCEYLNKECPLGFRKETQKDDCCPKCVEKPGVCVTYGDPHYKTFDNYLFNFQGECRYELAKDCTGDKFSIRVNNDARRSAYFSWTRSLSLKFIFGDQKYKISLGQRLRTKVNRKRIKLPYHENGFTLTKKGFLLTVKTELGVEVKWDGASYVEVKVDPIWRGRTCGLCGNFNGNVTDDKKDKKGQFADTDEDMAISWQSGKTKTCSRRLLRMKSKISTGSVRTQRLTCVNSQMETKGRCEVFNQTIFNECRKKINVDSFYSSCLLDLCECPSSRMCECDSIVAYVRECERFLANVTGWKGVSKCGGVLVYPEISAPKDPESGKVAKSLKYNTHEG
ncbi:BMP-binding endothelial regulator protein, partial [Armadillidium nasatum]